MQNVAVLVIVALAGAYLVWRFVRRAGRGAPCAGCDKKDTCAASGGQPTDK